MAQKTSFGIVDISVHLPSYYVDQRDLAALLEIEEGKLLKGLGLEEASTCSVNEDPVSLAMNAVRKLMIVNRLKACDVGRLEVGTESNWDGSKSLKTYLMDLFDGNSSISGCDTTNACYGGTNALFNAMYWLESSFYDGRYAIVVCTDICVYKEKAFIPLAGCASCAILLGPNPVLKFNSGMVRHCFGNTFDFCKPRTMYPYPVVDGKLSLEIYSECLQKMYKSLGQVEGFYDYVVFHTPYPRLPEKSCLSLGIPVEKVQPSLMWPKKIGNSYTSSIYVSLISLLVNEKVRVGQKILMYSFGSGSSSSLFVLEKDREGINEDFYDVFKNRVKISAQMFVDLLDVYKKEDLKKQLYHEHVYSGYYLVGEEKGGRKYAFFEKQ